MNAIRNIFFASLFSLAFGWSAAQATTYNYDLFDHPGGGLQPPAYGLRLDNLLGGGDLWTFSFENGGGSTMLLSYDDGNTVGDLSDDTVTISGTVYGGVDIGNTWDSPITWDVNFTYNVGITSTGGDGSNIVVQNNGGNTGYISPQSAIGGLNPGDQLALSDFADESGLSFIFTDDDYRLAGTGFEGMGFFVGRGWLSVDGSHTHAQDWLFIARPSVVPEPGTLALLGAGLLGLGSRRKKLLQ